MYNLPPRKTQAAFWLVFACLIVRGAIELLKLGVRLGGMVSKLTEADVDVF